MNIVLMAGGGGTRLWPLSRVAKPKQFLDLGNGQSLLQSAYQRALKVAADDHIYVATSISYEAYIKEQLPQVNSDHIFYEPEKRDTTAAFATVAIRLAAMGQGDVPTIFMWADHVFTNEDLFITDLLRVPGLLEEYPDHIIIVGHVAISPETTLGYIETGSALTGHPRIYVVRRFKEKPSLPVAKKYLAAGHYFWNLGYFSLKPNYLLTELLVHNPDLSSVLERYKSALGRSEATLTAAYQSFPKISIEYTLMEKTPRLLALTGDYGWTDVGYWTTVEEVFGKTGDHSPHGYHLHVNSAGNYIYNTTNKTVSLLGVKDTIVVVTDDAILITTKKESPNVKEVISRLEQDKHTDVL
jgi:mannose-1-phosphate guanylyltransferase